MIHQPQRQRFTLSVSGGSGSSTFTLTGKLGTIFISPPSGSPTLTYEVQDSFGDTRTTKAVTTKALIENIGAQCIGSHTFLITSASADGTYTVSLYWEHGV